MIGLLLAFAVAEVVYGPEAEAQLDRYGVGAELVAFALSLPLWILLARAYGLYDRDEARTDHSTVDDMFGMFNMVTVGALDVLRGHLADGDRPSGGAGSSFLFWAAAVVLVALCRSAARALCRRTDSYVQNTVIVGAGARRAAGGQEAAAAPRVRRQPGRLRRRRQPRPVRRPRTS